MRRLLILVLALAALAIGVPLWMLRGPGPLPKATIVRIPEGATMASADFDEDSEEKRPTVQVGDPFTEKCLLEACLELMASGAVIAIQDMGAAAVAGNWSSVRSTSMCSCENRSAGPGIKIECTPAQTFDRNRPLHILHLAHIERS